MVERFSSSAPQLICMKGPRWREELAAAAKEILVRSAYTLERVVALYSAFFRGRTKSFSFYSNKHTLLKIYN